ncbi:hypothetical protein P4V33_16360, partial [Brevibacillus borstelensis]|uniref:hypothetical protein n=1 Tax=Brevibacillus borstelensis TaxID=45462 RepID=UPI002E1CA185|nr:hypothetical protein [Brevibacillus borstelensis]
LHITIRRKKNTVRYPIRKPQQRYFAGLSQSGGMKKVVNSVFFIMPGSCDFILQTVLNHSAKPIRFRIRNIRE